MRTINKKVFLLPLFLLLMTAPAHAQNQIRQVLSCPTLMGLFNEASHRIEEEIAIAEDRTSFCGCLHLTEVAYALDSFQCFHGPYVEKIPEVCLNPLPPKLVAVQVGGATYQVELAETRWEYADGLACRPELPEGGGMLFVFTHDQTAPFWMNETFFPLDIIFIDSEKKVINVRTGVPMSTELLYPDAPYRYALEIQGGEAQRLGIGPGQTVSFSLP